MRLREKPELETRVQILKAYTDETSLDVIRVPYICSKEMTRSTEHAYPSI